MIVEKVFTKKEENNIINENYIPLKVNFKNLLEKDGLFMNETKDILLNEITEELNFIERIFFKNKFIKVYKKGVRKGFNWSYNIVR